MIKCCVTLCNNNSANPPEDDGSRPKPTYHVFPTNENQVNRWLANLKKPPEWKFDISTRICSDHFDPRLFVRRGEITRLVPGAVPTIFPEAANATQPSSTAVGEEVATQPLHPGTSNSGDTQGVGGEEVSSEGIQLGPCSVTSHHVVEEDEVAPQPSLAGTCNKGGLEQARGGGEEPADPESRGATQTMPGSQWLSVEVVTVSHDQEGHVLVEVTMQQQQLQFQLWGLQLCHQAAGQVTGADLALARARELLLPAPDSPRPEVRLQTAPWLYSPPAAELQVRQGGEWRHVSDILLREKLVQEPTYRKSGYTNRIHGDVYHQNLVMLLLLRARRDGRNRFSLALEYAPAGIADDIVYSFQGADGAWTTLYMQLKHSDKENGKIKVHDLKNLAGDNKEPKLSLKRFINSFKNVHCKSKVFMIVYTNLSFEYGKMKHRLTKEMLALSVDMLVDFNIDYPDIFVSKPLKQMTGNEWEKLIDDASLLPEDLASFQKSFVFAVNQPGATELESLVKEELQKECLMETSQAIESLYSNLLRWIQDNMKQKEGKFIDNVTFDKFLRDYSNKVYVPIMNFPRQPITSFHKREEELELASKVFSSTKGEQMIDLLITGTAGVGKTELALKIAQEHTDQFQHIVWIVAETEQSLHDGFLDLGRQLHISTADDKNDKNKDINLVQNIYGILSNDKCLVIFDNSTAKHQSSHINNIQFLDKYLPTASVNYDKMYFIMTSQYTDWPCNEHIPLNCFSMGESIEFLDSQLAMSRGPNGAQVADALGHLPLALQMAVAYIKHQRKLPGKEKYSLSDFNSSFSDNLKNLLVENPNRRRVLYDKPIKVMWDMAIESVQSSEHGKTAIQILNMLAFTEPDNIPLKLVKCVPETTEETCNEALLLLKEHSLIKYEGEFASIHRLLQEVTRNNCTEHIVYLDILLSKLSLSIVRYRSHVMKLWNFAIQFDVLVTKFSFIPLSIAENISISHENQLYFLEQHMARLESVLGWGSDIFLSLQRAYLRRLFSCQKYEEAIQACDTVQSKLHSELQEERESLDSVSFKASSLKELGRLEEALSLWQHLYSRQVQALGVNDTDTLSTLRYMCMIGCDLRKQGKPQALNTYHSLMKHLIEDSPMDYETKRLFLFSSSKYLRDVGREVWSLELYDHLHLSLFQSNGETDEHTMCALWDKAQCLYDMRRYVESWSVCIAIYHINVKQKRNIIDVLYIMCQIACNIDEIDKPQFFQQWLDLIKKWLVDPNVDFDILSFDLIRTIHHFLENLIEADKDELALELCDHLASLQAENSASALRSSQCKAYCVRLMQWKKNDLPPN